MGNTIIKSKIDKIKLIDHNKILCRTLNFCNIYNDQNVIIIINMKKTHKKLANDIQNNIINIKPYEYKSIKIYYTYDNWVGNIKLNGALLYNNFLIDKNIIDDILDISNCNDDNDKIPKNFINNNSRLRHKLYNISILQFNNILISFKYNNTTGKYLFFNIIAESCEFEKQSNCYQIDINQQFYITLSYNNYYTKNINWVVKDKINNQIHFSDNFIVLKDNNNIEININYHPLIYNKYIEIKNINDE